MLPITSPVFRKCNFYFGLKSQECDVGWWCTTFRRNLMPLSSRIRQFKIILRLLEFWRLKHCVPA